MLIETQAREHEQIYSDEHRKLLGAHYTPESVVNYIVRRTLVPLLELSDFPSETRILDPACGSGLFLLKAFDVVREYFHKTVGKFGQPEAHHVLSNCLFGIDIDERAIAIAKKHLLEKAGLDKSDIPLLDDNIIVADALALKPSSKQLSLDEKSSEDIFSIHRFAAHSFDCIIGNPPYVRIQNTPLEKRGYYSRSYLTASGRFDIATLFLELAEYLLKDRGRLGFIISNKILTTAGAMQLRSFLRANFSIEEIVNLTDTKLFAAAILPMILLASRTKENGHHIAYTLVTESHRGVKDSIPTENLLGLIDNSPIPFEANVSVENRVFQIQRFYTRPPSRGSKVWTFHNERENRLLSKIKNSSVQTLGQISEKISVGLKTTADGIFIKPMKKSFIEKNDFEDDLIFPLIESNNVERWKICWKPQKDLYVLYPHIEKSGKVLPADLNAYPRIRQYLEANRQKLEARTYLIESGRQWYEIWVHQSPSDFRNIKIVTPDISSSNRFAIDANGQFVNGSCFYIILKNKSISTYYSILGLLNSSVIEYFHKITSGNSLYAKRFRYWTSYIESYPIPKRLFSSSELQLSISNNVAELINATSVTQREQLEKKNDLLCYELFELTESEIRDIENTLSVYKMKPSKKVAR